MGIVFDEFEDQLERSVLEEGLRYYIAGRVQRLIELDNGKFRTFLQDTERIIVNLTITDKRVENYSCECPASNGAVCKHIVASLFEVRKDLQDYLVTSETMEAEDDANSLPDEILNDYRIDRILDALNVNELKDFVRRTCTDDRDFRALFLSQFAKVNVPDSSSKPIYANQIKNLIQASTDRHGYMDYREVKEFHSALSEILDIATMSIKNGNNSQALTIIFSVLEEVTTVIINADDSDGYLIGAIDEAFDLIKEIIESNLDEIQRGDLFNELMIAFETGKLDGWAWHLNLIELAIQLFKKPEEKERLRINIESIHPTGNSWDRNYRKAQEMMYELLLMTESEEAINQYLIENVSNPDFREKLVKRAINSKDYKYALKLLNDAIELDKEESFRRCDKWRKYQLEIYRKTGDVENTIRLARYFILEGSSEEGSFKEYYDLLKTTVKGDSWNVYLEKMIAELIAKDYWYNYEKLVHIYVWEKYWDRYLVLLQKNLTLRRIADAEEDLSLLYKDKLIDLYDSEIRVFIEKNVGRSYYIDACRYIMNMKRLGGDDAVRNLIIDLKATYKNRRALREELNKIYDTGY